MKSPNIVFFSYLFAVNMKLTSSQVSSARFHKRSGKGNGYKKLLFGHPKSFNGY